MFLDLQKDFCLIPLRRSSLFKRCGLWGGGWGRLYCLTPTEASRPIRDGDELEKPGTGANPEDQGCHGPPPEQQNVKAVAVRHCAATTAPRNYCPNCYAEQSHNVRSFAVEKRLKQKKSKPLAQQHLLALYLFWANLWVQHHLPPLDLAWTRKSV